MEHTVTSADYANTGTWDTKIGDNMKTERISVEEARQMNIRYIEGQKAENEAMKKIMKIILDKRRSMR